MKKRIPEEQSLLHMSSRDILEYSKLKAQMTNKQIAISMSLGEETIARYMREPAPGEHPYDLGIGKAASWCRATGNLLVPQWIDMQCRRNFAFPEDQVRMSIADQVRMVNRETADLVSVMLEDRNGDGVPDGDPEKILKELYELQAAVESAVSVVRQWAMTRTR